MNRDTRRLENSKQQKISDINFYPSTLKDGDFVFALPKGKPLRIYKKFGGQLWWTNLTSTGLERIKDVLISNPDKVYKLSHDSFADFVANEHIDWTDATDDFKTTGDINFGSHEGRVADVATSVMYSKNLYLNVSNSRWEFIDDGYGMMLLFTSDGEVRIYTTSASNSSGAGAAATPLERLTIDKNGNIQVGGTTIINSSRVVSNLEVHSNNGANGSFEAETGETVTVEDGIITDIS